jgi:hypothetical protein
MAAWVGGVIAILTAITQSRLLLFFVALLAHKRWHIPIADLEKLVRLCRERRRPPCRCRQLQTSAAPYGGEGSKEREANR